MTFAFLNWIILGRLEHDVNSIQDRIGVFYQTVSFSCTVPVIIAVKICEHQASVRYLLRKSIGARGEVLATFYPKI